MATKAKQERALKTAVTREKKRGILREERHVLWLLIAIIVLLLYLLLAQYNNWWPYARPKLGTAFYTNVSAETPAKTNESSSGDSTSTDNNGGSNTGGGSSTGSNSTGSGSSSNGGGSGGNNSGGGGTGGGSSSTPSSSLLDFAAGVNVGDSKTDVSGEARNLDQHCAVVVNVTSAGKQEVCTYVEGDKIVTVTYLNDRVISASKSGF